MRTIYLVMGANKEPYEYCRYWNVRAFASKEDAERFIIEKQEEYLRDEKRRCELDDKWYEGVITDEEKAEYSDIGNKWMSIVDRDDPEHEWYIKEIQFQE